MAREAKGVTTCFSHGGASIGPSLPEVNIDPLPTRWPAGPLVGFSQPPTPQGCSGQELGQCPVLLLHPHLEAPVPCFMEHKRGEPALPRVGAGMHTEFLSGTGKVPCSVAPEPVWLSG